MIEWKAAVVVLGLIPTPLLDTFSIIDGNDADGFRITALVERVFLIIHHVQRFVDRLRER